MVPTLPLDANNAHRQQSHPTSPQDGSSAPEVLPIESVAANRVTQKRGREVEEDETDADDEASPKRMRYREAVEDSDHSSSEDLVERFPRPSNSPPSPIIAPAQAQITELRNAQALGAFDTNAVYNPNDFAGRKPSQFNPYYRENGDMYTPFYNDRVGTLQFDTPTESEQIAGPSTANRAANVAHPMGRRAGHGRTKSRGTMLREVSVQPRGGFHRIGYTTTQNNFASSQPLSSGRNATGNRRRDSSTSPSGSFGPEDNTLPNFDEYISQPRA